MANWKAMAVARLKREREQVLAQMQPELDRIDRLIEGLAGTTDGAKSAKRVRKASTSRGDAMRKAWETRKMNKEAHNRAEARQSPGASLREAAAG